MNENIQWGPTGVGNSTQEISDETWEQIVLIVEDKTGGGPPGGFRRGVTSAFRVHSVMKAMAERQRPADIRVRLQDIRRTAKSLHRHLANLDGSSLLFLSDASWNESHSLIGSLDRLIRSSAAAMEKADKPAKRGGRPVDFAGRNMAVHLAKAIADYLGESYVTATRGGLFESLLEVLAVEAKAPIENPHRLAIWAKQEFPDWPWPQEPES